VRPANGRPRRGEVWLVDFGEPIGHEQGYRRPAVVISSDRLNASRAGLVVVVPLTTTRRALPSHVELEPDGSVGRAVSAGTGLRETSYAKTEDLKSVSIDRLVHGLGQVPHHVLHRIEHSVTILLDLP
jgi:mRNA interferase MazF